MTFTLFIVNDAPYGNERAYNALRLAGAIASREGQAVRLFPMADAVGCANSGQKVPAGYCNVQIMPGKVARKGEIGLCGTCVDARGLRDEELIRSTTGRACRVSCTWRGFTGRRPTVADHVAGHATHPSLQPHLSLIPAATLVASYRDADGYASPSAFREAARSLAGEPLATMLEEDLHALQDRGFDALGEDRARLRARYAAVQHPMAAEVVRWLGGSDTVDGWVEDA